jgi:hypothetical protein
MKTPNLKTKIVHSQSKPAWNIIGDVLGGPYKIARIPYVPTGNEELDSRTIKEAFELAEYISYCLNNPSKIIQS